MLGLSAYMHGDSTEDNPYPMAGVVKRMDWDAGWLAGYELDKDQEH